MLPARRYRPRHAAPRTPATAVVPAGLLLSAAGVAFAALPSSPAPAAGGTVAPQTVTLALSGLAPTLPAEAVAQEQVERRARVAAASARAAAQEQAERKDAAVRASRSERRAPAVRPVAEGPLTSPFGRRWGRLHAGLDFGVPVGTPVVAVADGVVEKVEYDAGGYGHYVVVQHADGTSSLYAHLSKVLVERGPVQAGDAVGRSGNTGHSTGPHLHFEVRSEQGPLDPRPWLRERGVRA